MNLQDYYQSLDEQKQLPPKIAFLKEVSEQCKVEIATVRNWILYGKRPQNPEHTKYLEQRTGIPASELWSDNN